MTTPQPEPSSTSTEVSPDASPVPPPTILIVVLHLDCPSRVGEAPPPKYLFLGLSVDGLTIQYSCLGCGRPLGLRQVPLDPDDADIDGVPPLHNG